MRQHRMRAAGSPRPAGAIARSISAARDEPRTIGLVLLWVLWIAILFDPHWWLAVHGPDVVLKLPVLGFAGLLVTLLLAVPANDVWRQRWQWYAPYVMYLAVGAAGVFTTINVVGAREAVQTLFLWWTLIVGSAVLIGSVRRAETLIVLYGLQFLWWAIWGAKAGLVVWHPTMSNYDGFGAFNVGGLAICYYLGMASGKGWFRRIMFATAGLCAMGVVTSFARGAFLSAVLLYGIIWLRSPHKGKTLVAGIGGAIIMFVAADLLFEDNFFWNEIMSAFHEGTEEGTGEDRWILWGAAYRVFQEHPLIGAGLRNWGVVGSTLFQWGELGGQYANPGALYSMSLHNLYMTTLSEMGILGSFAFVWIIFDFFRRNAAMRTPAAVANWQARGGRFRLDLISYGLEGAMVAFLVNSAVYSMMGLHWMYTMLAVNIVFHSVAVGSASRSALIPAAQRTMRRMSRQPPQPSA